MGRERRGRSRRRHGDTGRREEFRPRAHPATPRAGDADPSERELEVTRNVAVALYVVALIAVVVIVDVLFFRQHFWERLIANVGIVLVFAAFALRFLRTP
jgi:hypothetical protein